MTPDETVKLLISIEAQLGDIKKVVEGMKDVGKAFEDTGEKIKTGFMLEIGQKMARFVTQIPRQMAEVAKQAVSLGGDINDMAEMLKMSAESFQVLSNAAREAGVEQSMFTKTLTEMGRSINEARANTGNAAVIFEQLGLNAGKLINMSVEDQFTEIATAIAGATDKAKAFEAVSELFGSKTGPKMQSLLERLGKMGFGQLAAEISETWGIMSNETVRAMDEIEDRFNQMKNKLVVTVAEALPKLQPLIDAFATLAGWLNNIVQAFVQIGTGLGQLAGAFMYGPQAAVDAETSRLEAEAAARARADAERNGKSPVQQAAEVGQLLTAERMYSNVLLARKQLQLDLTRNSEEQARIADSSFLTESQKNKLLLPLLKDALDLRERDNEAIRAQRDELQKIDELRSAGFVSAGDNSEMAVASRKVKDYWAVGEAPSPLQLQGIQDQNSRQEEMAGLGSELAAGKTASSTIADSIGGNGVFGELKVQMTELMDSFATIAESIAEVFSNALNSVSSNLTAVILQTKTWGEAFAAIGTTILTSVVSAIVQMSVQWVARKIIEFTLGNTLRAAALAANATTAVALSSIWAAPAALATIATYGGAAVQAPITIAGSVATTQGLAIAGFRDGGFTGYGDLDEVAGPVHRNEVVFSHENVQAWGGVEAVERLRVGGPAAATIGAGVSSTDDYVGAGGPVEGTSGNINQAFFNTRMDAESWLTSQPGRRFMTDYIRQMQYEL